MLRRHLSRASSKLLPSDTSLYNAIQAIIGQELRARYETPQEVPPEMLPLREVISDYQKCVASLWRRCEAAPKRRPRTSIRGQVGHDAHPEGRHSKDGHPQPQPASWQAFGQDKILSRIPEPRPETHMPSASNRRFPDPVPNAQVICKKSSRIGHRSADQISAAAHVPARA